MRSLLRYLKSLPPGLFAYWALLLALIFAFALLAEEVLDGEDLSFDAQVLTLLDRIHGDALDALASLLDVVGGSYFLLPVSVVVVFLLWRRHRRGAVFFALAFWGATLLNGLAKLVFERARPELFEALVPAEGYAFPSGHTMGSTAFALAAALILRAYQPRWWWLGLVAGVLFAFAVGASRSYLQVHYPSDVLAGWSLSTAWVLGAHAWYSRTSQGSSWFERR